MLPKAIDPKLWGASAWYILHRLSFGFRNAKVAREFYMSLLFLLPCPKCRANFAEHIKKHPFPTHHKNIPEWCVHLHNMVNESVGKEKYREDLRDIYIRYMELSQTEWTFIAAIVDSHPGKQHITWEHVDAIHTFLTHWSVGWTGVIVPSRQVIRSKALLQQWFRKNDPSRTPTKFGVCSTNTCEIRVGGTN